MNEKNLVRSTWMFILLSLLIASVGFKQPLFVLLAFSVLFFVGVRRLGFIRV